jgi:hypothetical protein
MAEKVEAESGEGTEQKKNSTSTFGNFVDLMREVPTPLTPIQNLTDMFITDGQLPGESMSREEAGKNVDDLVKKLGISMSEKTDPAVMRDVLHNVMKLDDCPAVVKLLGERLTNEESMAPMLERIRKSILTKHPAMLEFISKSLKENSLPEPTKDGQQVIKRTLNHMVLLDTITKGMAEDPKVMEEVRAHLLKKREQMGIREPFFESAFDMFMNEGRNEESLFLAIKTKSVDAGLDLFSELRKNGRASDLESLLGSALLDFNIAEAVGADVYFGLSDNARAGLDLILNPASKVWVAGQDRSVKFDLSQDWDSLYESWNMAFVSNLANPDRRYAKLLIPQVIDAKPEDYVFNRALALWLTLNFDHFHALEGRKSTKLPNARKISEGWGAINRGYGAKLGRKAR